MFTLAGAFETPTSQPPKKDSRMARTRATSRPMKAMRLNENAIIR
jgi:hypothetical protein